MLINRNITVGSHRTSVRLEPVFWESLAEIAEREGTTIDGLCTDIDQGAGPLSRTAAIRVFVTGYYARLHASAALQAPHTAVAAWSGADSKDIPAVQPAARLAVG